MNVSRPRVSIIIRSRNAAWVIHQTLTALFAQDFREFDVLVVDSGSEDATCQIAQQFPCQLMQIEQTSYFPGPVLNDAIEKTQGEILVFLNSDCVPVFPSSLRHLLAGLESSDAVAAFGRQLARPEAHRWVRRDYAASFPDTPEAPAWINMSLAFAAMKRKAWEEHRFYGDAWASEDQEWAVWAKRNGHRIEYVPNAAVMHSHNYTLRQLYGRRYVEGEADAFIHQDNASFLLGLGRAFIDSARDVRDCLGHASILEAFEALPRRLVYHYAYCKGHKWGEKRLSTGNENARVGQTAVLSRYDDGTAS